jgi:hypothetical protein
MADMMGKEGGIRMLGCIKCWFITEATLRDLL